MSGIIEREDIAKLGRQTIEDLIAFPPKNPTSFALRITSGTTGREPIILVNEYVEKDLGRLKDTPGALVTCHGARSTRLGYMLFARRRGVEKKTRMLALDGADLTPELTALMADFKPDSIQGFCSFALKFGEHLDAPTGAGVQQVGLGGEVIRAVQEQAAKNHFPNASIRFVYNTEVGSLSKPPCGYLPRNFYHPRDGITVEADHPDERGVGDLLVSKCFYKDWRVERYRLGDVVRLIKKTCICGAPLTFEALGRAGHDYIKLAGALLRREEFDRAAQKVALFEDYRVEAEPVIEKGVLVGRVRMQVFRKEGIGTPELAREIEEKFSREVFVTPTQTFANLVEKQIFLPLVVKFVRTPFSQKHKEIKLVQKF